MIEARDIGVKVGPEDIIPGPTLCVAPDMLTTDEAVRYMRLDRDGAKSPERSLQRYCRDFAVQTMKVGHGVLYPLSELKKLKREIWKTQHPKTPYPEEK